MLPLFPRLTLLAALVSTACGSVGDERPARAEHKGESFATHPASVEQAAESAGGESECEEGNVRDCVVPLPEHNGVKSCFEGVSICTDGVWGACVDPDDVE